MQPTLRLILPTDYVRGATEQIKQATTRVHLLTMVLVHDDATERLLDALVEAAKRGVHVSVAGDSFTYTDFQGNYIPTTYRNRRVREAVTLQKRLREAGAEFNWLGRLSMIAFTGRTHIKWCIVDDMVYSFGGVNMDQLSTKHTDYMFTVKNDALADRLVAEQNRIIAADQRGHAYRSHRFGDEDNMVLLDGGFLGDSIIYRRACYWAARAESVLLVSQYCPTGKLSRLLNDTDAQLYFNHWTNAGLLNRLVIRMGMFSTKQKTSYHRRNYLHAKFIIFTLPDGSKVAITGSHNFVRAGVFLGTREVALETTNKQVIAQLETFFKRHVK
ncbi:MAG TPA: phospholipase D-like domain-containing protein [Candidatus Saccharimonadales bacterium]|jgi:cardiolipin synthase